MSLRDLAEAGSGIQIAGGVGILLVLMTIVQVSPIRIDPWTWLAKLIRAAMKAVGKAFNADLTDQVKDLRGGLDEVKTDVAAVKTDLVAVQEKVDRVQAADEERDAISCRTRILRFGDEVMHGVRHSKDHFDSILRDAQDYRDYCDAHSEFKNGVTEPTIRRIEEVYAKCLEENDFL